MIYPINMEIILGKNILLYIILVSIHNIMLYFIFIALTLKFKRIGASLNIFSTHVYKLNKIDN
ncbi:MAG TPA: hypothetical protein DCG60_07345 [Tissierella sp.]|nr:hypothetical protein [Tissierella sp.]